MPGSCAPAFAFQEQHRAEGMAARVVEITSRDSHPSAGSLPLYRECARLAFETAAAHAEQPERLDGGEW